MSSENPKLFISYSWSSPLHEKWVIDLAKQLCEYGVNVILDKWDLRIGHDAHSFMERMVSDPEIKKVALICDHVYSEKANKRSGGVGKETQIISAEIYEKENQNKFVAIVTEMDEERKPYLPNYYRSRIYIDFSDEEAYINNFEQILRWIYDKPLYVKPKLGKKPAIFSDVAPTLPNSTLNSESTLESQTINKLKYNKITLLFPGQGSHYVGMGRELHENYQIVRDIYNQANDALKYNISEVCFTQPSFASKVLHDGSLDKTKFIHPAVLTTSFACFKVFEEQCRKNKILPNIVSLAGHGLGEYTALLVSNAVDFSTCLKLVQKRADLMVDTGSSLPDARLMAVVGRNSELDIKKIETYCRTYQVSVALYNTKRQVVVGGFRKNLYFLGRQLRKDDIFATIYRVEGPYNTSLMKPAADKFRNDLEQSEIFISAKPIISGVSTEAIVDPTSIRKELYDHIFMPINWTFLIQKAIANGTDLFIEIGPKRVFCNMLKDINKNIPALNVEDMTSLEKCIKKLGEAYHQSPHDQLGHS